MNNTLNPSPLSKEDIVDIGQYVNVLLNLKWRIIMFSILITLIGGGVVSSIPSQYTAKVTLLIESKQVNIISIEEFFSLDTKSLEYYLTQVEILKSDRVAMEVIKRLDLVNHPDFSTSAKDLSDVSLKNKLLEWFPIFKDFQNKAPLDSIEKSVYKREKRVLYKFKRGMTINPVRKTQLVNILYTCKDSELSAMIANEIGRVFIENNIEAKLEVTLQASKWLNEQTGELRDKLHQSEVKLQAFLQAEDLVDIQGVESLASLELTEISSQLNKARDRRIAAQTLYQVARDHNKLSDLTSIPEILSQPTIRDVKVAVVQAERKVSELSKRYGPKHPDLKAALAELDSVTKNLNFQLQQLLNGISNELKVAKQVEQILYKELESSKTAFQKLTVKNAKYSELKREVQTNLEIFNRFLSRQKETSASSNFKANIARFIDYATPPLAPSTPNRKAIIILAFLASFGFACVMAFIADAISDKITSIMQVNKHLSLELLGIIPLVKPELPLNSKVYFDKRYKQFSESIRTVRTEYLLADINSSVVMLTSSQPAEGKTTSALNLAFSLAKMEKTLLLECNFRTPAVANCFGLPITQLGVTEVLVKTHSLDDCIFHDEVTGLDVLVAGAYTDNALDLISSSNFSDLINELKTRYNRVVIDTSPCLEFSDTFMLSRYVDSVIVVINASKTSIKTVRYIVGKLARQGVQIDGVILNKLNVKN